MYWKRNWAIKEVASRQITKTVGIFYERPMMWLYNPISKFWYHLRTDNDRFSTLVQGSASFCFDLWIKYVLEQRDQITAQFHDEGVWQLLLGYRKEMDEVLTRAIDRTNNELKLNRELAIGIQYGTRYSHIH